MERKILFKAKRLDNGEFVEGDLLHKGSRVYIYHPYINNNGFLIENLEVDPSTVCQFTGLKDKDGNSIWEHDLVDSFPISEVVYIRGSFMLYQKDEDREGYHPLLYFVQGDVLLDCRVISSKFDRKEGEK